MLCECATLRYSLHLSTMYGHNHAFFDPNIWHLDEELRKQVETFAKCFIMTGQEAPETNKKLHVDLHKKIASAVDESSVVSFWTPDEGTNENSKAKILLDMVAGASSSSSEHGAEAAPGKVAGNLIFDEEHDPTIDDGIKTLLAEEVAEISANLQSRSIRRDGRRLCPMCPFRSFKHMVDCAHTFRSTTQRRLNLFARAQSR